MVSDVFSNYARTINVTRNHPLVTYHVYVLMLINVLDVHETIELALPLNGILEWREAAGGEGSPPLPLLSVLQIIDL